MIRAALLLLVACGSAPAPDPEPLPPNIEASCSRAEECGVFTPDQHDSCVACLEHVNPVELEKIREEYGDLPPLETVDCPSVRLVAVLYTNIAKCVDARWYGP